MGWDRTLISLVLVGFDGLLWECPRNNIICTTPMAPSRSCVAQMPVERALSALEGQKCHGMLYEQPPYTGVGLFRVGAANIIDSLKLLHLSFAFLLYLSTST